MLQELDAYERLHEEVRVSRQRSVLLDDTMVTLMSRVGAVMNQQGNANVPDVTYARLVNGRSFKLSKVVLYHSFISSICFYVV